ncbi:hypothetical protein KPH14_007816 [Odynerus spinipes]|uniref:Cilia- and flagella-associated protein 99 n=1 Tax=Odynerus spinipes TaxID=1348599 RepID=A0AAD9S186_9HYME|nr:hypothetical protein KPH14_007816 [Odynerus spinipes]
MLDAFLSRKHNLSSDEFCLVLFLRDTIDENDYKSYSNSMKYLVEDVKEIQVPPESLQYEIAELFMSIVRFEFLLRYTCEDFFKRRHYRKSDDLCEIIVLIYILIFHISSLTIQDSMDFFVHFKIDRMLNLVSYLLRKETLDLFYTRSCNVFEESFVQEKIYEPYLLALPRLKAIRIYLREEKRRTRIIAKKATVPIFMNVLNHVKRTLKNPPPTPEDLTERRSPRKVPKSTYLPSSMEKKLNSLRQANKTQALCLLHEANENAPACSQRCRNKFVEVQQKIEKHFVRKPLPTFKPVKVKQNATSILRECARIANEELKEVTKLQKLVEGNLDPESISKLEEEKRQQEKEEEINKMQEKHLTALLTREGAYIAKKSLLNENKSYAQSVREERKKLYCKLEKLRMKHNMKVMETVEKCRELEQASRDAYHFMMDEKRQKAAEVSEESRQLRMLLCKQKEEEMQRKAQLIKEIKEIQTLRLAATQNKEFDPTETSGLGLLCEMSLAELKGRLCWVKIKLNEELEKRQVVIQQERERQKNLVKYSKMALDEYKKSKKSDSRKSASQNKSNVTTSPQVLELQKKLEEKRALRMTM